MTEEIMRELALTLASVYAADNIEKPVSFVFRNNEIAVLRASERIRVVIIREHDEPQHPLYESAFSLPVGTAVMA